MPSGLWWSLDLLSFEIWGMDMLLPWEECWSREAVSSAELDPVISQTNCSSSGYKGEKTYVVETGMTEETVSVTPRWWLHIWSRWARSIIDSKQILLKKKKKKLNCSWIQITGLKSSPWPPVQECSRSVFPLSYWWC
jgi:hypothetical protein